MELIRKSIIPSSNQEWLDIRGTKIDGMVLWLSAVKRRSKGL